MNYIDLFAGCGGLSLGLFQSGIEGIFAIEKNEDAFETLKENLIIKHHHFDWPDWLEIKNWDINELISEYQDKLVTLKGRVDLIVGGPPCQGFSLAGRRDESDIRNSLVRSYIKFVEIIKPKYLFFENVHGFTVAFKKSNGEKAIPYSKVLINELKKLGYNVEFQLVTMSEYGVPQKRKRFILFASLEKNSNSFFSILNQNRKKFLKEKGLRTPITIKQAIGDLEKKNGETESIDSKNFKNGKYTYKKNNYQKLMRMNLERGSIPDSHRFAKHRDTTIEIFEKLMASSEKAIRITPGMGLVDGLKKRGVTPLKPTTVCSTITSIPDDFIHYSEPRIMTVREYARIQSFPDDFKFKGKYTTGGDRRKIDVPRYTQVANAVPPLFAEQVGLSIQILEERGE